LLVIYALENGVEQALLLDDAGGCDGGAHVVDLDAIADVEGVLEEDEDAADHEFVYGSAGGEGEAYDDYGGCLLEGLEGFDV